MSRFARRAQSATNDQIMLYLTPAAGSYTVNDQVVINIREDSNTVAVNAVQANLTYPTDKLQYVSTDTTGSPFSSTVQNDGGSGSVQLGVAFLGGSTTGDQLVAKVTFTALAAGTAGVQFAAGSSIADYANASDVCQAQNGGSYTIS